MSRFGAQFSTHDIHFAGRLDAEFNPARLHISHDDANPVRQQQHFTDPSGENQHF